MASSAGNLTFHARFSSFPLPSWRRHGEGRRGFRDAPTERAKGRWSPLTLNLSPRGEEMCAPSASSRPPPFTARLRPEHPRLPVSVRNPCLERLGRNRRRAPAMKRGVMPCSMTFAPELPGFAASHPPSHPAGRTPFCAGPTKAAGAGKEPPGASGWLTWRSTPRPPANLRFRRQIA